MEDDIKFCNKCGVPKLLSAFYKATGAKDGHRGECIDCSKIARRAWYVANKDKAIAAAVRWHERNPERVRDYQAEYRNRPGRKRAMRDLYYRRTFGMTADDFDAMLEAQGGGCAICERRPEREASLHVDHDHLTGAVRGILCIGCNQGIGQFGEDPDLLERAATYLRAG